MGRASVNPTGPARASESGGIIMVRIVISYIVFTALVFGALLFYRQFVLGLAWLAFAGLNAMVLRTLFKAPSYYEKLILDCLDDHPDGLAKDALLDRFRLHTPNLKPRETGAVFATALARLEGRGLVRTLDAHPEPLLQRTVAKSPKRPSGRDDDQAAADAAVKEQ